MNVNEALIVSDDADRRELAVVRLSDEAVHAISKVIGAHEDEFRKAAAAEGVRWEDVLQPDWYRGVRLEDAQHALERSYREDGLPA